MGAFRSLQLFNSDSGVGLRTQKRGFKRGNSLILGKLYVKSCNYTIKGRDIQNINTGRAYFNSPGIGAILLRCRLRGINLDNFYGFAANKFPIKELIGKITDLVEDSELFG